MVKDFTVPVRRASADSRVATDSLLLEMNLAVNAWVTSVSTPVWSVRLAKMGMATE
jgi:hypothetical protein